MVQTEILIESEVGFLLRQNLDFGQVLQGQGRVTVPLNDPGAGNLLIRSDEKLIFIMHVKMPEYLRHTDTQNRIPVDLRVAVNSGPVNSPAEFTSDLSPITHFELAPSGTLNQAGYEATIFIYGELFVGHVLPGTYSNEVIIILEY